MLIGSFLYLCKINMGYEIDTDFISGYLIEKYYLCT